MIVEDKQLKLENLAKEMLLEQITPFLVELLRNENFNQPLETIIRLSSVTPMGGAEAEDAKYIRDYHRQYWVSIKEKVIGLKPTD